MAIIYQITNSINGKRYIGKVGKPGKTEVDRLSEHICNSRKKNCQGHIHRAIRLYGHENFSVELVETCAIEIVDDREKFWISKLKPEYNMTPGGEGGSTTHNRFWCTDGSTNKYLKVGEDIPDGFRKGRTCKFSDPEFQKEMASRVDRKKNGDAVKKAWDEGRFVRDHSKCGIKGENNPAKRPEVRDKISKSLTGRKWTPEMREAKSLMMKGKKRGRYLSKKT